MNAVEDISRSCVLTEGVAGAGKTTEAIRSADGYLEERPGSRPRVLMLTLTVSGAEEIGKRTGGRIRGHTVHSFCRSLLRTRCRARRRQLPRIIDPDDADSLLLSSVRRCCPDADPEETVREITGFRAGILDDASPGALSALDDYRSELKASGATDFTGILEEGLAELEKPETYRSFDGAYVICDEVQDFCPGLEWRILDILRRRSERFMMYASPSQEIYPFRGADYARLRLLMPDSTETRTLSDSWRCSPEVVEVARHLGGEDAALMRSRTGSAGFPAQWFESANESLAVRTLISGLDGFAKACPGGTSAILAPSGAVLDRLALQLGEYGIKARRTGGSSFRCETVRRFADLIAVALTGDGDVLDSLIAWPGLPIPEKDLIALRGAKRLRWEDLERAAVNEGDAFSPILAARARSLLKFREEGGRTARSDCGTLEKVARITEESGVMPLLEERMAFQDIRKIRKISESAAHFGTLGEFLAHLRRESAADGEEQADVELSTFHSSKGREWDSVSVMDSESSTRRRTGISLRTARNAAYVACTRAKKNLLVSTETETGYPDYFSFMKGQRRVWYR